MEVSTSNLSSLRGSARSSQYYYDNAAAASVAAADDDDDDDDCDFSCRTGMTTVKMSNVSEEKRQEVSSVVGTTRRQ
jgi:hypothetical protein